jgi:hypothetical protein
MRKITIASSGRTVFAVDGQGQPSEGVWGPWLVTLAGFAAQLAERFGAAEPQDLH